MTIVWQKAQIIYQRYLAFWESEALKLSVVYKQSIRRQRIRVALLAYCLQNHWWRAYKSLKRLLLEKWHLLRTLLTLFYKILTNVSPPFTITPPIKECQIKL